MSKRLTCSLFCTQPSANHLVPFDAQEMKSATSQGFDFVPALRRGENSSISPYLKNQF